MRLSKLNGSSYGQRPLFSDLGWAQGGDVDRELGWAEVALPLGSKRPWEATRPGLEGPASQSVK